MPGIQYTIYLCISNFVHSNYTKFGEVKIDVKYLPCWCKTFYRHSNIVNLFVLLHKSKQFSNWVSFRKAIPIEFGWGIHVSLIVYNPHQCRKMESKMYRTNQWKSCSTFDIIKAHGQMVNGIALNSSTDWKNVKEDNDPNRLNILLTMNSLFYFPAGFSGELCNFEYNECDSNPCLNNGGCTDHIGGFSCKCTRGFTGKRCHLKVSLTFLFGFGAVFLLSSLFRLWLLFIQGQSLRISMISFIFFLFGRFVLAIAYFIEFDYIKTKSVPGSRSAS